MKGLLHAPRKTNGRGTRYDSILDTVGDTPVIRINRIAPEGVNMFVKIEAFNPAGSVKDRLALNIIEAAEASGALKPGQTVVEATSTIPIAAANTVRTIIRSSCASMASRYR